MPKLTPKIEKQIRGAAEEKWVATQQMERAEQAEAAVVALREALIEVQKIVHFAPGSDVEVLESVAAKVDAILANPNPGQGLLDVVEAAIEWERHAMWEKGEDDWSPANEALGEAVLAMYGEQANKPRTPEPVD